MKAIYIILLLILTSFTSFTSLAFGQTTPNLGLNIPPFGTTEWNVLLNANFSALDSFLSGVTPIPALSITGNLTVGGNTTDVGTGTYSAVFTSGTNAGMVTLLAGPDNSSNCTTSQVCREAPTAVTKYDIVSAGAGPTARSVLTYTTLAGILTTESFTPMPPQLYEAGVLSSTDKIYTNTQALTAGAATHTFANSFTFTSTGTFGCTCTDQTGTNACKAVPASATTVTIAGTGTDTVWLSCSGH